MQIHRGKAWEVWLCDDIRKTDDRHTGDHNNSRFAITPGVVMTNCIDTALQTLLASEPVMDIKGFKILHWALPPVHLPSVYLMSSHVTKSPRPPPLYLHTASDQILKDGMGTSLSGHQSIQKYSYFFFSSSAAYFFALFLVNVSALSPMLVHFQNCLWFTHWWLCHSKNLKWYRIASNKESQFTTVNPG